MRPSVSGIEVLNSHVHPRVDGLSTVVTVVTPGLGRHSMVSEHRYTNT